ncbi:PilT/PilU family type 4a pilus ATPase [Citrobacter sp. JGM124]|uniref:type IV pilus twitching motility protein PilT n=1 Tax=Citrobacter sp. JGM124 TaxID=2799789 RepID=UPI001BA70589|nr:PilT/PilU family type 4a pilus ATPase [Citrobacter sp. JGM124]MBS0849309.1 PilT/PilU family type 4a pilus ATPase [Citrobacter sp. JGM124]
MDIDEIVSLSVKHNASDLHLCPHQPIRWRRQGKLEVCSESGPSAGEVIDKWLNETQKDQLLGDGQVDFSLTINNGIRLRGQAFCQQQGYALAVRLLPDQCPRLDALGMPASVLPLLQQTDGLILLAGATGSGKSTSLAAMVEQINQQFSGHIMMLEEPVEYLHQSALCLIQQREIGQHCACFFSGLKAALRQDPDVIVLGELRDCDTLRLALTAAETGHLVLATLHARDSVQAIERLINVFPASEKEWVRYQLAGSLRAILAQKLVMTPTGRQQALFELLLNLPAVANIIREGKIWQLPGILQTGQRKGMQSFEQSRRQLLDSGEEGYLNPEATYS